VSGWALDEVEISAREHRASRILVEHADAGQLGHRTFGRAVVVGGLPRQILRRERDVIVEVELVAGRRHPCERPPHAPLEGLEPGDVLIVTRLDRLARSTRDLLNVLDAVAKAKAGFRSLKDTWADTTTPHGRLMLNPARQQLS